MAAYDAFYSVVRKKLNLAEKPVMEGFSRGGLPASLWSIRNLDKVAGVYLDAAVMNILSWPRGRNPRKRESAASKLGGWMNHQLSHGRGLWMKCRRW